MPDVSATGLKIKLICLPTFPAGISISQFADDADPLDTPDLEMAQYAMDINGSLVLWRTPKPIEVDLNVLPNTQEDQNLSILADTNRVSKGKVSVADNITLVATYPDGTTKVLDNGALVSAPPMTSAASAGRLKTKHYKFVFQGKTN